MGKVVRRWYGCRGRHGRQLPSSVGVTLSVLPGPQFVSRVLALSALVVVLAACPLPISHHAMVSPTITGTLLHSEGLPAVDVPIAVTGVRRDTSCAQPGESTNGPTYSGSSHPGPTARHRSWRSRSFRRTCSAMNPGMNQSSSGLPAGGAWLSLEPVAVESCSSSDPPTSSQGPTDPHLELCDVAVAIPLPAQPLVVRPS